MDLRQVLDDYVVTAVPHVRATALSVVWSEPGSDDGDVVGEAAGGVLAVLDDYRITRVPKAS
jgi:hypothetical protein